MRCSIPAPFRQGLLNDLVSHLVQHRVVCDGATCEQQRRCHRKTIGDACSLVCPHVVIDCQQARKPLDDCMGDGPDSELICLPDRIIDRLDLTSFDMGQTSTSASRKQDQRR